jgi:hypothetical protein
MTRSAIKSTKDSKLQLGKDAAENKDKVLIAIL